MEMIAKRAALLRPLLTPPGIYTISTSIQATTTWTWRWGLAAPGRCGGTAAPGPPRSDDRADAHGMAEVVQLLAERAGARLSLIHPGVPGESVLCSRPPRARAAWPRASRPGVAEQVFNASRRTSAATQPPQISPERVYRHT